MEELEKARRDEGEEKVGRVLREELHREFPFSFDSGALGSD